MDQEQGFRERENTTIDDIKKWSVELGSPFPEIVDLGDAQFRCAGSAEYVTWLESVLTGSPISKNQVLASSWRTEQSPIAENIIDMQKALRREDLARAADESPEYQVKRKSYVAGFDFKLFDNPGELEAILRQRASEGNSVRLLSSYSREWKTAKATSPHELPASMQDFCETYLVKGEKRVWSRPWNFVPNANDYTAYVRAAAGSRMADDSLCEVGCPYAIRGFDYDCHRVFSRLMTYAGD